MAGLETQVREALINQRTEELVKYASASPEYKAVIAESAEVVMDSIIGSMVAFGDIDEEKKAEMKQKSREELLPQVQAQLDDPEKLRQIMHQQAKNEYLSTRGLKAKLRGQAIALKNVEMDENVLANYLEAYKEVFEFTRMNDELVKRLAKIAETEGLDRATQKATINSVIKEMYPTPDKYRALKQKEMEVITNMVLQAQTALMADGETGQIMGGMIGDIGNLIKKNQEALLKINRDYSEKRIQEIYG